MRRKSANAAACRWLWPALALLLVLAVPYLARAQVTGQDSLFSPSPSDRLIAPETGTRGNPLNLRGLQNVPAVAPPPAAVTDGNVALALAARFGKAAPFIDGGLIWRVYAAKPDANGKFRLVKKERSPSPTLMLPPGAYIVDVGFGLATAVKPVTLRGPSVREVFDLPVGALRLEGMVGDVPIPTAQISFSVYKGSQFEPGNQRPIANHVMTGEIVVVPHGVYHIVSYYGDANAVVRSDIRVQAGMLTDITINHRAAVITLKLVTQKGGEALANTAWSVLTPGGDIVKESIGAFPRVILAQGEYRAIARNEGKVYQREFKVIAGVDGDVEVMAR